MTTVGDAIEEARRRLYGGAMPAANRLTSAVGTSDETLSFDFDLKGVTAGTLLGLGDELVSVWDAGAARSATVQRGALGTTAAVHAAGALVEVNPRFPRVDIRTELTREIRSWLPRLYRTAAVELEFTSSDRGIDLGETVVYRVLEVSAESTMTDGAPVPLSDYQLVRGRDTSGGESGNVLVLYDPRFDGTVRATLAVPFDLSSTADGVDLVADVGLAESMLDIPAIGVEWRMLFPREIARTSGQSQPQPRSNEDVPPMFMSQAADVLSDIRRQRIAEEASALASQFPIRGG